MLPVRTRDQFAKSRWIGDQPGLANLVLTVRTNLSANSWPNARLPKRTTQEFQPFRCLRFDRCGCRTGRAPAKSWVAACLRDDTPVMR
jgi:hypothetical protein